MENEAPKADGIESTAGTYEQESEVLSSLVFGRTKLQSERASKTKTNFSEFWCLKVKRKTKIS